MFKVNLNVFLNLDSSKNFAFPSPTTHSNPSLTKVTITFAHAQMYRLPIVCHSILLDTYLTHL